MLHVSPPRRPRVFVLALAILALSGGGTATARAETPVEAAHRKLGQFLQGGKFVRTWDRESIPRLCELWVAYARAAGLPENPSDYAKLRDSVPADMRAEEDYWVSVAVHAIRTSGYRCPPRSEEKARSPLLIIGGGAVAAGTGVALAAGGGETGQASPPPAAPPDVSSLHGTYAGRLVTGASSVAGCGRAATAPCNALLGGSASGTPATLSFGGALHSTGILRPGGALESFVYEGPASGLGGAPDVIIAWRQRGEILGTVMRMEGTVTVISAGPCNGAVMTTLVEVTKN
jgi:hypothetical protein